MGLTLALGLLFLIFAAIVAGIIFAVKKWGLRRVCEIASYGIAARLFLGAFTHDGVGQKVPRIAAGVILLAWPYSLEQKKRQRELIRQRENMGEQDEPEYLSELRKQTLRD